MHDNLFFGGFSGDFQDECQSKTAFKSSKSLTFERLLSNLPSESELDSWHKMKLLSLPCCLFTSSNSLFGLTIASRSFYGTKSSACLPNLRIRALFSVTEVHSTLFSSVVKPKRGSCTT